MTIFPTNPYGVTIGLNPPNVLPSGPVTPYSNWSQLLPDMATLGLSRLRFQLSFFQIAPNSPNPATWNWQPVDDAVYHATQAGFNVSFVIRLLPGMEPAVANGPPIGPNSTTGWGVTNQTMCVPTTDTTDAAYWLPDPAAFALCAAQTAARYNGVNPCISGGTNYGPLYLSSIELGNEEFTQKNLPGDRLRQACRQPRWYIPVLQQSAPLVRQVHPTCKIGTAAIWALSMPYMADWLRSVCSSIPNISSLVDFYNVHYYSNANPCDINTNTTPSVATALSELGAVLAQYDPTKKVRLTEFGWGTTVAGNGMDCDMPTQALRYLQLLDQARLSGVCDGVDFFTLDYKTGLPGGPPSPAAASPSSLVQLGMYTAGQLPSPYIPAFSVMKNYVEQFPQWNTSLSSGTPVPSPTSSAHTSTAFSRH